MSHTPMHKLLAGILAAGLGLSVLTSCAEKPDLDGDVATQLQQRVATAKQHAAQQDLPTALTVLDQLSQEVAAAAEQGKMSGQRKNRIEAVIGSIKSDLETAMAPPQPAPAPASPLPAPQENSDAKKQEEDAKKQEEEAKREAEKKKEEQEKEADKDREEGRGNG